MRKLSIILGVLCVSAVSAFPAIARERAPHPRQAEIDSLFKAAQECLDKGDVSNAISPLQQIISIDLKNDRAYLKLGDTHLLFKNLEEAESAFKKALSIRRSAEAYDGIGRALMEGNRVRTRQAIDYFRDALTLGWNNAEVHYHLALALWKLKDLDALPAMERAQRMSPEIRAFTSSWLSGISTRPPTCRRPSTGTIATWRSGPTTWRSPTASATSTCATSSTRRPATF